MEGPSIPELVWAVNAHIFNYIEMEEIVRKLRSKFKAELIEDVMLYGKGYTHTQLNDMMVPDLKWLIANIRVDTREARHVIDRSYLELSDVEVLARQWFVLSERGMRIHGQFPNAREAFKWCRIQCQDYRRWMDMDIEDGVHTYIGPTEATRGPDISTYYYGRWRSLKLYDQGEWDPILLPWLTQWVERQLEKKKN